MLVVLLALIPRLPMRLAIDPQMDWRVFAFALGIAVIAGIVAGLIPAWQASRPRLFPALRSDAGATDTRQRLRSALLIAQITLSMLLLVVAGLFARALAYAENIDPGFRISGVHLASLDLTLANYDSVRGLQIASTLLERARHLPQVDAVALSKMVPLDGSGSGMGAVRVDGRTPPDQRRGWEADWNVVTPGYFDTLRIPLVKGRDFSDDDRAGSPDVAILNETFARALWPDQEAVGRTFRNDGRSITVIGVARDAKYRDLGEAQRHFVYVALAQRYTPRFTLMVRTPPAAQPAGAIRRLVAEVDPTLPIVALRSLEEQTAMAVFPQRLALWIAGSLGLVAMLLVVLGIYGVTAFSVVQRTREIGVRVALGATTQDIVRQVMRTGLMLTGTGIAAGTLLAMGLTGVLRGLLYAIEPTDPIALAGAATLLSLAAACATWVPARRAGATDPVIALRTD